MTASIPAGSRGNHDRFPIWRMPYYRLGWSGWTPYGCTCLRYEGREEESYRVCIHRPTNGSRRASGRRTARRGVLRRERSWGGRGDGGRRAERTVCAENKTVQKSNQPRSTNRTHDPISYRPQSKPHVRSPHPRHEQGPGPQTIA